MKKVNEKLSELFDIDPVDLEAERQETLPTNTVVEEDDYSFARKNLRELISKGSTAIDEILFVAKESEHPRAFEVASNFLKNLSELNKDLLQLSKTKKEIEGRDARLKGGDINVEKAVFVGSTNELSKLLKKQKEEENG
jgi:hypothetical protein